MQLIEFEDEFIPSDEILMEYQQINQHLCAALGVDKLESLVEVVLRIKPQEPATLTVIRYFKDPERLKTLHLKTESFNVIETNFVSH